MDKFGRNFIMAALETDPIVGPASKGTVEVHPDDAEIEERGGDVRNVAIHAGYLSTRLESIFEALSNNALLAEKGGRSAPMGKTPFLHHIDTVVNPNGSQTLLFQDSEARVNRV